MELQKLFGNLFLSASHASSTKINNLLKARNTATSYMLKLLACYLLITSNLSNAFASGVVGEIDITKTTSLDHGTTCYPINITDVRSSTCIPMNKMMICLNKKSSDDVFIEPHGGHSTSFLVPDLLFNGDKRELDKCKFFNSGVANIVVNNVSKPAPYDLYSCHTAHLKQNPGHAIYYAGRIIHIFKQKGLGGYIPIAGVGECIRYAHENAQHCINSELLKTFVSKDADLTLYEDHNETVKLVKNIADKFSAIEDKNGEVKPWPFSESIMVTEQSGTSNIAGVPLFRNSYSCDLVKDGSDIFSAKYTCKHNYSMSFLSTIDGPIISLILAAAGVATIVSEYLDWRNKAKKISKILRTPDRSTKA